MRITKKTFKEIYDNPNLSSRYGIRRNACHLVGKTVLVVLAGDSKKELVGTLEFHRKIGMINAYYCDNYIFFPNDVYFIVDLKKFYYSYWRYHQLSSIPTCIQRARDRIGIYDYKFFSESIDGIPLDNRYTDEQLKCMKNRKVVCSKCYRKDNCLVNRL